MEHILDMTSTATDSFTASLNVAQRQAVEYLDGPLLVLAGAGTGKTRVLTHRVAAILERTGTPAYRILCVTFTNKAAREMRQRVAQLVPDKMEGLWLGTFHALAVRIIRRYPAVCGLTQDFLIIDRDDQYRLVRQILQEKQVDPKKVRPGIVLEAIQGWKDRGLEPERVPMDEAVHLNGLAQQVYTVYQARLLGMGACDFGDLLLYNIKIFAHQPEVLQHYQERFRYILVDEYQDTNYIQNLWLSLLAHQHRQLCCVGDDDQSIYGWRGAEIRNILEFQQRFPEAEVIRLEENYRSTQAILSAAAGIIDHNQDRLGKQLVATQGPGEPVTLQGYWDSRAEAIGIADQISQYQLSGIALRDMAVLIRAAHVSQTIETSLNHAGIAYRIYGGLRFYEREEIRDAVAYLRLVARPDDDLALTRIINKPTRGIGQTTQERIRLEAEQRGKNQYDTMCAMLHEGEFTARAKSAIEAFVALHQQWQSRLNLIEPAELLDEICEQSGMYAFWRASGKFEAEGKLENLGELQSAIAEFESLNAFLDHVALVMDDDRDQDGEYVTIMTIHAAKGLEFAHVFLPAWEEGIFPNPRALGENIRGLSEERRLAYVAITRARQRLSISFARARLMHGQWHDGGPSRFLQEIPSTCLSEPLRDINARMLGAGISGNAGGVASSYVRRQDDVTTALTRTPTASVALKSVAHGGQLGQRCQHSKFGEGTITALDFPYYQIEFDDHGQKKISADFITLLDN